MPAATTIETTPAMNESEAAPASEAAPKRTPTYEALMVERVKLRRQVTALKGGSAWLEKAADVCGSMGMRGANILESVHHARSRFLPDRHHAMPLCDIERTLHRQGMNALVVCILYEVMVPAIERQLDAMKREMEVDPAAVERYGKAPQPIYGTLSCWPGRGAGRPGRS